MITPEIYYTMHCDRCGEALEGDDGCIITSEASSIWNEAQNTDWIEHEGKHYCPDCYYFDKKKDDCLPLPDYPKSVSELEKFLGRYVGYVTRTENPENFLVSTILRTNEQLRKEYLEMIRLILTLESWEFEVTPANGYSKSKLIIKIDKQS